MPTAGSRNPREATPFATEGLVGIIAGTVGGGNDKRDGKRKEIGRGADNAGST